MGEDRQIMNRKELQAIADAAAKRIKTEEYLNEFRQMLTKITVEAALNVELDEHPGFARHEQSETDSRRYGSDRYSYDALGNVRSRQFGGSTRSYSYDASHNRISSMPGAGAFSYDDRGNVSQAGTFTLTRNRANELIGDALGSSFAYDARGWRVKKHVIAGATHTDYFIYDSNHRLMERIDNGTRSDFVYLGQKAIARITNNKPSYIFGDYQNSPLFESNSAGSVTRAPNFVGYGHPDSTGVSEIPGYSGAAPDAETGLLYLGARYLYAERFLSPDPAALDPTSPVDLNRYAYANDNPVRFTDPDGRQVAVAAAACAASPPCVGAVVAGAVILGIAAKKAGEAAADYSTTSCSRSKMPSMVTRRLTTRMPKGTNHLSPVSRGLRCGAVPETAPMAKTDIRRLTEIVHTLNSPHPDEKGCGAGDHYHDWRHAQKMVGRRRTSIEARRDRHVWMTRPSQEARMFHRLKKSK